MANRRSKWPGRIGLLVFLALAIWILGGTEWTLVTDKDAYLQDLTFEQGEREGESCTSTIDTTALPAAPSAVEVNGEDVPLEGGRGTFTVPATGTSVPVRLTFTNALMKPSHADIGVTQQGCRLQATSFSSMPFLPF